MHCGTHSHHRRARRDPAATTSSPGALGLRVSDQEREDAIDALREHAADGRLGLDEFSERLDTAHAARTRGDVDELLRDLPSVVPPGRREAARIAQRRELARHASTYALVMVLLVAIWAISGAGYFWPIWPLLGWGIGVASHGADALGLPTRRHDAGRRATG